jgi:hypothetical protein
MRHLAFLALASAPVFAQAPTHLNVPAKQLVTIEIKKSGSEASPELIGGITLTKPDGTVIDWNAAAPASGQTLVILDLQAQGQRSFEEGGATAEKTYRPAFTGYHATYRSYPYWIYLPVTFPPLTTSEGTGHYTFPGGLAFAHPLYPMIHLDVRMGSTATRFFGHGYLVSSN